MTSDANCIFCKIVRGEIAAKKLHEDDDVLAFHDVRPQAPVHFLIIPKVHVPSLYEADMSQHRALGKMLALAGVILAVPFALSIKVILEAVYGDPLG